MTPRVYHRSFLVFFFPDRITNFAYTARVFFFCSFFAFIQSASPLIIVWSANFFSCRMAFKSQIDKKGKETKTKRALFNFCLVSNEEEEADSVSLPLFLYNYVSSFLFIYYRVVGRRTCLFKYTPCLCVCVWISSFWYPIDPHLLLLLSIFFFFLGMYCICLTLGKEFVC